MHFRHKPLSLPTSDLYVSTGHWTQLSFCRYVPAGQAHNPSPSNFINPSHVHVVRLELLTLLLGQHWHKCAAWPALFLNVPAGHIMQALNEVSQKRPLSHNGTASGSGTADVRLQSLPPIVTVLSDGKSAPAIVRTAPALPASGVML